MSARRPAWPDTFATYFGVADEIYDSIRAGAPQGVPADSFSSLTLADLEPRFVAAAQRWAASHDMPWPPLLPAAEEYALDHPEVVR